MAEKILDFETAERAWKALKVEQTLSRFNPKDYDALGDLKLSRDPEVEAARCPICRFLPSEKGFIRYDWPLHHPYFGAAVKCPRCWGKGRG